MAGSPLGGRKTKASLATRCRFGSSSCTAAYAPASYGTRSPTLRSCSAGWMRVAEYARQEAVSQRLSSRDLPTDPVQHPGQAAAVAQLLRR